jgi:outer membrane lipoprotein carrier protein
MNKLKHVLFFIVLFSVMSCVAATHSAAAQLSQLLNHFTTLQAQFTQITHDAQGNVMQKSMGTVMIARPGRFRFETVKPMHQIVITNGKVLWVYDVALKQATQQPIAQSQINPARILSGHVETLLQQFTVRTTSHKNRMVFQLIPKKSNQQFHSVEILFTHDVLSGMKIESSAGQTTQFDFSNVKLNARLPSSLFEFKAPKGVNTL